MVDRYVHVNPQISDGCVGMARTAIELRAHEGRSNLQLDRLIHLGQLS